MRRVVIDAATFVAWFGADAEPRQLRAKYEAGQLGVLVPPSFVPDVLGLVADRGWRRDRIVMLARALPAIGFEVRDPRLETLARWLGGGVTPAQAAYPALAEDSGRPLVASDPVVRKRAASVLQR